MANALANEELLSSSGQPLSRHWVAVVASIWTGQAFSIISSSAAAYALVWYVTESTGSALWLSIMMICSMLPTGLLSPFGGIVADRLNRKAIMIVADAAIGLLSLVLGLAMLRTDLSLPIIVAFAAARSVGQAFHSPAFLALVPMLVPERQLLRFNMLDQLAVSVASMASPAFGIFVFQTFGLPWALFLDAIGAVGAILGLLAAHVPTVRDESTANQHVLANLRVGWHAIARNRGLLYLLLLMLACWVSMAPVGATFPLMTLEHFHGDGYMASIVEAAYGGGLILGSVALIAWNVRRGLARLVSVSYLAVGLTVFLCGLLPADMFGAFLVLNVLAGVFEAGFNGPLMTLVQKEVPGERIGRSMGLITAVSGIGAPVGIAIFGPLGDVIGVPAMLVLTGSICIGCGVWALIPASIRALDADDGSAAPGELPQAD